jgi:hypothetical protein
VIDNIGDVWAEMSQSCMNGVWRNIWPDFANFHGFDSEEEIGSSRCAIIYKARTSGFEGVDEDNVKELFQSHMEKLSNEGFLQLDKELNDESSDLKAVSVSTK